MVNRIDLFETQAPKSEPTRVIELHAELSPANQFDCQVQLNAGTAFQNIKMYALTIKNLSDAALLDLEKLEQVADNVPAQKQLEDIRLIFEGVAAATETVSEVFQVVRRTGGA